MVTQIAVVNFIPGGVPPHVKVSQGDTAERVLQFQCYFGDASYSIPSGSTVIVNGAKPGGTVFTRSATFSGNVVTLPCAEGMTDTAGKIPCEIMVTTSSGTISSANFVLEVEGTPVNDAAVSASDLSAMTELAAAASQAAVDAAASAAQADADVVNTVKYSDIVNTGTTPQTQTGTKALDAVQNNPNVAGTMAAKIENLRTNLSTVYTAAWTADSAPGGSGIAVTESVAVPAGLYLIVIRLAYVQVSSPFSVAISGIGNFTWSGYNTQAALVRLSARNLQLVTMGSASTTFLNYSNAGITAIRLSD